MALGVMTWHASGRADDTPAPAPTVSDEGADALARSLTEGLDGVSAPGLATFRPEFKGKFRVVPADDHYDVTIPAIKISSHEGSQLNVKRFTAVFTPTADGNCAVTVNTPLSAWWYPRHVVRLDITVDTFSLTGTWSPAAGLFLSYDGNFDAIKATPRRGHWQAAVRSCEVHRHLTQDPSGAWSGSSTTILTDAAATDQLGNVMEGVGGATLAGTFSGFDVVRARAIRPTLQTHARAPGGAAPGQAEQSGADESAGDSAASNRSEAFDPLAVPGLLGGYTDEAQAHDLVISSPDVGRIAVDAAGYSFRLDGLDQEQSTVGIRYSHSGLDLRPPMGRHPELLPQAVAVDLTATAVPTGALLSALSGLSKAGFALQDLDGEAVGRRFVDAMQRAGSEFHVNTLHIVTPAAAGDLTATVGADEQAAYGVTGSARLQARGLDAVLAALLPTRGRAAAAPNRALIARLEALGQAAQDADGQQTMSYALELTAGGKVTLNGTDLSTLLPILLPPLGQPSGRATP